MFWKLKFVKSSFNIFELEFRVLKLIIVEYHPLKIFYYKFEYIYCKFWYNI